MSFVFSSFLFARALFSFKAIGPIIEGVTRGTCEKYGFTGGFQEAMQSISAEGGA